MKYNPEIYKRRSIRLKGYDYSQSGAYFVTICTWQRECLLGDIINGEMRLNEYGIIIEEFLKGKIKGFIGCKNCDRRPRKVAATVKSDWDKKNKTVKPDTTAFVGNFES